MSTCKNDNPCRTALHEYMSGLLDVEIVNEDHVPSAQECDSDINEINDSACVGQGFQGFTIGGLRVFVPSSEIRHIDPDPPVLGVNVENHDWIAGYYISPAVRTAVVDIPFLLGLGESAAPGGRPTVLVSFLNKQLALAVPNAGEQVILEDSEIISSGPNRRRRWLAGTAANYKAVLLDINGLVSLLPDCTLE